MGDVEMRMIGIVMILIAVLIFMYILVKPVRSKLKKVTNKNHEWGSHIQYYGCEIIDVDGKEKRFLFTENELKRLRVRAEKNKDEEYD